MSVRPHSASRVRAKNIAKFDCQNNELFGWRGTGKFTGTYGVFEPVKHRGDTRAGIIRFEPYSTGSHVRRVSIGVCILSGQ